MHYIHHNLDLKVPPVVKKRGRPKGSNLTVISLPMKKSKKKQQTSRRICTFSQLHTSEKIKGTP